MTGSRRKEPKSIQITATVALVLVGGFATFAIAYASVIKGDGSATALLGTLATAALAALVVLAGGGSTPPE